MADEGFTPVVENDPAAAAFLDDEIEQSVDPLLNPQGQSVDPVPADPGAVDLRSPLADISQRARGIVTDPVPLLVARVHEEIQQILRLQRDICDGVELAADQVQDKRIDFLEAGPEVTVADIFIEVALVFFLESPLVGLAVKKALRQAYRFARPNVTTIGGVDRATKLTRLRAGAEKFRSPVISSRNKARLKELEVMELQARLDLHRARTPDEQAAAKKQLAVIQHFKDELATIPNAAVATTGAAPQRTIEGKDLRSYFIELDEMAVEYGVGVVKAGVAGVQKGQPTEFTRVALDSISVQLKSLSQAHLRNLELDLGLAAADADMLRSIAQSDPFVAPDCIALLSEMLGVLQRAARAEGQEAETVDARKSVMIEVEKLIWALLVANAPPLTPEEKLEIRKGAKQIGDLGSAVAVSSQIAQQDAARPKPPRRMLEYWRGRFFAGEELSDEELAKKMRELRDAFMSKGASERLMTITTVPFKTE